MQENVKNSLATGANTLSVDQYEKLAAQTARRCPYAIGRAVDPEDGLHDLFLGCLANSKLESVLINGSEAYRIGVMSKQMAMTIRTYTHRGKILANKPIETADALPKEQCDGIDRKLDVEQAVKQLPLQHRDEVLRRMKERNPNRVTSTRRQASLWREARVMLRPMLRAYEPRPD